MSLYARVCRVRSRMLSLVMGMLILAGCGGGSNSTSSPATFREFPVPVASNDPNAPPPGSWPDDLRSDSQGNIWFAEHHSNEVGRIATSGVYTGFPVPTHNSEMDGCAIDNTRGLVWVTEVDGDKLVRVEIATGKVTEISVPTPNASPGDLSVAADGTVWFTEGYEGGAGLGRIARLDPATNQITEISPPTANNGMDGIVVDTAGSGAVWFVALFDNQIGRYLNGQFQMFTLPRPNVTPTNPALDSQGRVWVTEQTGNALARLDPTTGSWEEITVPTANSQPSGIAIDRADNVWFTEYNTSKIGLLPAGAATIEDFTIPTPNSGPEDICIGADGTPYFTEQYGNKIGHITVTGIATGRAI